MALVDFIMKTLYNEKWGPWNSILGNAGSMCLATHTPPGATGTGDGGDGVTTVTPPDTDITGGFEVGMHVECNKGGQGTYLPAVVNGISEDTGGGNPRVSVCYDGQTRANGGCEDLISADRCRIPSGSPGAGIPANGSVTQAGGSCAGNTRACGPNLRCGLQADGANKDKCISTGTATASTFRVGDSVECTRVGTTYSAGTVAAVPNIQLTSSPISVRFASDNATVEITASKCRAQTSATCTAPTVSTGSPIVSSGAVNVLKGILRAACISSATISSGWRDPANQARVMYDNLESRGVADQRALYGSYGDQVIDVYEAQKAAGKTPTEIKSAMEQKIIQVGPGHVSAHSDTAHNTFDVAPTSIPDAKKSAFVSAINAALSAGTIHKRILPPNDPAYHIEVSAPQ